MARKPPSITFEEAAAIPQAGVIALRAIRTSGEVQPGQRVLINGAGGSAGSFAIQLARLHGAEVIAVDNAKKLDFMRSLGANQVIDHTREDFTSMDAEYDLILDLTAHHSIFSIKRALSPGGTYYYVGGSVGVLFQTLLFGPLLGRATGRNFRLMAVPQNREDLVSITELCVRGDLKVMIDRRYPLSQVPDALQYVSEGNAKGKVIISVENGDKCKF